MPRSSQVLVFSKPRLATIQEEVLPEPGEGEVLIQTICTLISMGTELTAYRGEFPANSAWSSWVRYPFRPGYSSVGIVVARGDHVDSVNVGDRVFNRGSHATFVVRKAAELVKVPEDVSSEEAAFASISNVAMNGVRMATLALGEAVGVVGSGMVGLMATQYARRSGAFPLIALDISEERLRRARSFGATGAVNSSEADALTEIGRLTKGRLADVVFEVTGNPSVIPSLPKLIRRGGRLILLGSPRGSTTIDFHDEVHRLGLHVIGAHASNHPPVEIPFAPWTTSRNTELFLDLLQAHEIHVGDLITHRYPAAEAPEVFRRLSEDRTTSLGVILEWSADSHVESES